MVGSFIIGALTQDCKIAETIRNSCYTLTWWYSTDLNSKKMFWKKKHLKNHRAGLVKYVERNASIMPDPNQSLGWSPKLHHASGSPSSGLALASCTFMANTLPNAHSYMFRKIGPNETKSDTGMMELHETKVNFVNFVPLRQVTHDVTGETRKCTRYTRHRCL